MKSIAQGAILAALVAALLAALTFVLLDRQAPSEIAIQTEAFPTIMVDVSGGVSTPGLYALPGASRLQQAIDRAGGLTAQADVTSLNLAGRLVDGDDVVIPVRALPQATELPGISTPGSRIDRTSDAGVEGNDGTLIDLNTAGAAEFDTLPGVGPVIAGRIIEYRNVNGPFATIDELAAIQGISPSMVEEIRPLVTLGG